MILTGGLLLPTVGLLAAASDNPYKSITARNSFALVAPPPPAPVEQPPPPANIKLTGISTLWGDKRAMLMVQDTSGPGKPDLSYILREGQRDGQVEVLSIDDKNGIVKVKNAGVVSSLSFDQNGIKVAGLPVPPPAGSSVARPPNALPAPPAPGSTISPTMTGIPQPPPRSGLRQVPTRQLRLPNSSSPAGVMVGGSAASSGGTASGTSGSESTQPQVTAEEQAALILIDQEANRPLIQKGKYPPPLPLPGE
jgi:hypothetical protein